MSKISWKIKDSHDREVKLDTVLMMMEDHQLTIVLIYMQVNGKFTSDQSLIYSVSGFNGETSSIKWNQNSSFLLCLNWTAMELNDQLDF